MELVLSSWPFRLIPRQRVRRDGAVWR